MKSFAVKKSLTLSLVENLLQICYREDFVVANLLKTRAIFKFFSFSKKHLYQSMLLQQHQLMTIEIASQPCLILAASSSQRCLWFWHHTVCLSFLPAFFHFFALAASTKSSKSFPSNSSLPTQKRQRRRLRRSDVLHS